MIHSLSRFCRAKKRYAKRTTPSAMTAMPSGGIAKFSTSSSVLFTYGSEVCPNIRKYVWCSASPKRTCCPRGPR